MKSFTVYEVDLDTDVFGRDVSGTSLEEVQESDAFGQRMKVHRIPFGQWGLHIRPLKIDSERLSFAVCFHDQSFGVVEIKRPGHEH